MFTKIFLPILRFSLKCCKLLGCLPYFFKGEQIETRHGRTIRCWQISCVFLLAVQFLDLIKGDALLGNKLVALSMLIMTSATAVLRSNLRPELVPATLLNVMKTVEASGVLG